ncbi:MAG: hypothetical protein ABW352_19715 [Polyangiales bacterium]
MTSLFGKAPDSPEFVREGRFGEPEAAIERALLAMVERGHALAPARYLAAGPGYVRAGAWIASRDALGRAFPLAIALPLPEQTLLSIVPLHYLELLDTATEALHTRREGVRAKPYLTPPHPSMLLPRVHLVRSAWLQEPARRFQLRTLGTLDEHALGYALATLCCAAELDDAVALAFPDAGEDALFAWLELLGVLSPTHALSLIWRTDAQRAWLGWSMELTELSSRLSEAWPLTTDDAAARREASSLLSDEVRRSLERDASMAEILAGLARHLERARAV